jgi:hypothetical protein
MGLLVAVGIAAVLVAPVGAAADGWTYPTPTPTVTTTPTPTPTPTPTTPVVPVPALFAAEPTPPTCETAGSFDFAGTFPNVVISVTPAYTGPGTYTLTATATGGATFPDGTTTKTRVITVAGALGFQSTDANAPCYRAPEPTPTPTSTPSTSTSAPTPTPSRSNADVLEEGDDELAATGSGPELWGLASVIVLAGVGATALAYRRRPTH